MTSSAIIVQWFASMGMSNLLTTDDLLSGNTLHMLLKKTINGYKMDLVTPNSAVNKVTNWNNLIKSLQKINIKITNDKKNNIFHGDQNSVYDILVQVKGYTDENLKQAEVDINKIDHRSDPRNSKSLLELFILVIIKNLGLNAKESVALLSNDSKYLAHILAKGFKDQANPVLNMLKDFQSLQPKIREFCINKQNEVFFMKSIKPGLISKFREISELSLQILEEFSLQTGNPFETLRLHLIPTMVLQYRRHPVFLNIICKCVIKLSKYTKPLLSLLTTNMSQKQLLSFSYEILCISQQNSQLKSFYSLSKVDEIVVLAIDSLNDSNLLSISLLVLIKMLETNMQLVGGDLKNLNNMLNNLQHLTINKTEQMYNYINGLFTLLQIFGRNKHSLSPQIFKLCVQKYKISLNSDESTLYAYNFFYVMDKFPSIPNLLIVEAVFERYESYKEVITELDVQLLMRVAYGYNRYEQQQKRTLSQSDQQQSQQKHQQQQKNPKIPDQKTVLKIYNTLSKIFFQNVHNSIEIADTIVFIVVSHPSSQLLHQLTIKLFKVSLAVHYANLRKLNIAKSIIQGTVKLDSTNALPKRKNLDIQYLLKELLSLHNQNFNHTVQPLICYSYMQSNNKNQLETQGLYKLLSLIGNPNTLIKKYQQDVKILHDQKKNKKKHSPTPQQRQQSKITVSSSDLLVKKKLLTGQNYSMFLSRIEKVTPDAKNGLLKAQKGFEDKKRKVELQEIKKIQDDQKKQELQRKFTLKVLEKGIRVDPKMENLHQYLYEFNVKQNQIQRDLVYDLSSLQIFNPSEQQENDMEGLKYLMKKYNKVLKVFYSHYGGKLRPNSISLFDQLAEKQSLMTVANVWKLFKDFELNQFITIRETQYLVQKINSQKKKSYYDTSLLDFQALEDFIIQASLTMFSRPPKNLSRHTISEMVEETFYQFKMLAAQNKIDIRLFDDDLNLEKQDDNISQLNSKLRSNPDYILPQGYKKVVDKKVEYFHNIALDAFNQSYTDVLNILDQVIFEKIGFHMLEPFSQITTNVYAKSLLSKKKEENTEDMKEKYFSVNVKKQLFKYSGEDRIISRQVAYSLSEIVDAVEIGRKSIVKAKYTVKISQEQKRKAQDEAKKKRQKRDLQLKKILEKHKTQKQQTQQNQNQQKINQDKKIEDQKKKRQKYEQDLKKKVEQYQQKKQQFIKKEEQERQKQKKKQQQLFDKKRQQLSKAAKQIQEKKEKQKLEAEQKQKKQKELLKQKSKINIKIRSSPMPAKKRMEQKKNLQGQKSPDKENESIVSSSKKGKV